MTRRLPYLGILTFVCCYFVAVALYSGGTRLDPSAPGYSHFGNSWCDLLDATALPVVGNGRH